MVVFYQKKTDIFIMSVHKKKQSYCCANAKPGVDQLKNQRNIVFYSNLTKPWGWGFSIFYLDTGACLQFAQAADQGPAAGWDVGDFGDGLHPLRTGDAHLQDRAFVTTNSALSARPHGSSMLAVHHACTSGIHRAQLTWAHLVPARVAFMAPPFLGHRRHWGLMPRTHVLHSQFPKGTLTMP